MAIKPRMRISELLDSFQNKIIQGVIKGLKTETWKLAQERIQLEEVFTAAEHTPPKDARTPEIRLDPSSVVTTRAHLKQVIEAGVAADKARLALDEYERQQENLDNILSTIPVRIKHTD